MIVDTSAFFAILMDEPEKSECLHSILKAPAPKMSAVSAIEVQAVLTRRWLGKFDERAESMMGMLRIAIVPVSVEQSRIARIAYRTYGIGTLHPARLNFGDCFAYALSKATGEPLLFKGDDFAATDVVAAIPAKGSQPAV